MWILNKTTIIDYPRDITINDVQHPAQIFTLWSKDELASIGIRRYHKMSYGSNQRVIETLYEEKDGEIFEKLVLEDVPMPETQVVPAPANIDALRRQAYPPYEQLIVALWEKVIENKDASAQALQQQRIEVKQQLPKNTQNEVDF